MRALTVRFPAALLAAGLLALGGCAGDEDAAEVGAATSGPAPTASPVAAAALRPGQAVPPPADQAVLVVTGRIGRNNQGSGLALDLPTLARLGLAEVAVHEPWRDEDLRFRGVWLQDLLAVADVDERATRVHVTAIDDYTVDIPLADVRRGGVFLAFQDGTGADLALEDGGPARIVFVGGVDAGRDRDQWIWSLTSLDVR